MQKYLMNVEKQILNCFVLTNVSSLGSFSPLIFNDKFQFALRTHFMRLVKTIQIN